MHPSGFCERVQEVLEELGHSGIPLHVILKAAEIQFLDVVDKVLSGNKWLRKATGIQPKFPYWVDSFENRSAASFPKAAALPSSRANSEDAKNSESEAQPGASELSLNEDSKARQGQSTCHTAFQFSFGDWFSNPWSKSHEKGNTRISGSEGDDTNNMPANPLLPKITMVGILMGETGPGQVSRANLKKTMADLTKVLEMKKQILYL